MNLNSDAQLKLQQAFADHNLYLKVEPNFFIIEKSENLTQDKIRAIVEKAQFYPIVSENKIDGKIAFTVSPCPVPTCFIKPQLGRMEEQYVTHKEEKCADIERILGKKISTIQAYGTYSAIPRSSNESERKAASDSRGKDGNFRYAFIFENREPITIKWLMTPDVFIVSLPKTLFEQQGRAHFKWYSQPLESFWFCNKEDYSITLRGLTSEDLKTSFWKGSVEERKKTFQNDFIERNLFGNWLDHWDCMKGGMVQPYRLNFSYAKSNFQYNSPVHDV